MAVWRRPVGVRSAPTPASVIDGACSDAHPATSGGAPADAHPATAGGASAIISGMSDSLADVPGATSARPDLNGLRPGECGRGAVSSRAVRRDTSWSRSRRSRDSAASGTVATRPACGPADAGGAVLEADDSQAPISVPTASSATRELAIRDTFRLCYHVTGFATGCGGATARAALARPAVPNRKAA